MNVFRRLKFCKVRSWLIACSLSMVSTCALAYQSSSMRPKAFTTRVPRSQFVDLQYERSNKKLKSTRVAEEQDLEKEFNSNLKKSAHKTHVPVLIQAVPAAPARSLRMSFRREGSDGEEGQRFQGETLDAQKKWSYLSWKFDLGGRFYQSERESAQLTFFSVPVKFQYLLNDQLKIRSDLSLVLGTGRSQSLYGDVVPSNSFGVTEAVIDWTPVSPVSIQAGAVDTAYMDTRTLNFSWAFPGASEKLAWKNDWFKVALVAQQTIPTSTTLNTQTVEKESTPSLTTESAELSFYNDTFELGGFYKHFRYSQLPSFVADRSKLGGNTVYDQGVNASKFKYGFEGFFAGGRARYILSKSFDIYASNYIVINNGAIDGTNRGQTVWGGVNIVLDNLRINPEAQVFFMESDVAPAYYTSSAYGRNNREGYGATLKFDFLKSSFSSTLSYVRANVLNRSNAFQGDQEIFTIRFETFYDRIL